MVLEKFEKSEGFRIMLRMSVASGDYMGRCLSSLGCKGAPISQVPLEREIIYVVTCLLLTLWIRIIYVHLSPD